jgi:uncharacterized protein YegL
MKIKTTNLNSSITFEYEQIPHTQETDLYVMSSLKAPLYEPETEGKESAPIEIVCVIDKSGSMSGQKLDLVKSSLNFMVEQMKEHDFLSIITFDTDVSTILGVTQMNKFGKEKSIEKIKTIRAGTCTNLSGGLFEAYNIMESRVDSSKVCSILLFTDGLANKGLTKTQDFVDSIQKQKEKLKGPCPIYTFGFGSDHDANMLKCISETSNGLYYYVAKEDEIPTSFADCLGGLLSIVAQNIKVTIQTVEGVTIEKSLSSYPTKLNIEKTSCELILGDIYSEENRDLVFILKLSKLKEENKNCKIFDMNLSYFNVIEKSLEKSKLEGSLSRPIKLEGSNKPNVDLDKQRNRIETSGALEKARTLADSGKLEEARNILKTMISKLKESISGNEEFTKNLMTDLEALMTKLESKKIYNDEGSKWMHNFEQSNKAQRSTKAEYFTSTGGYENKKKKAMKFAYK